jgi:Calx-beta domain-containing protein
VELTVRLSAPSSKTVQVDYYATSTFAAWPAATAGSDYEAISGTLKFAPGETAKSILVPVYGDRRIEYDENFDVVLNHARGASVADPWGHVTILDSSPALSISTEYVTAPDGQGSAYMTFTVSLSAAYDLPITVNFATQDGFDDPGWLNGARAGEDYVACSGTLTFAPGETTQTITIQILGDNVPDYDEYLTVKVSSVSYAHIDYSEYGGVGSEYGGYGFISGALGSRQ